MMFKKNKTKQHNIIQVFDFSLFLSNTDISSRVKTVDRRYVK